MERELLEEETEPEGEKEQGGKREKPIVRAEEIPPVPENRFLLRRDTTSQEAKTEMSVFSSTSISKASLTFTYRSFKSPFASLLFFPELRKMSLLFQLNRNLQCPSLVGRSKAEEQSYVCFDVMSQLVVINMFVYNRCSSGLLFFSAAIPHSHQVKIPLCICRRAREQ